jgi:hypothetical protein
MNYRKLFPLVDFTDQYTFEKCLTLQDFLKECVSIYFTVDDSEARVKESCLSVYMAFRDHYPDYLNYLDQEMIERLDFEIGRANPKIIKLRRIVIGALSKVA